MEGPTRHLLAAVVLGLLGAALAPGGATAQEQYSFTVSLLGGAGGSLDEDQAGFGNGAFQLGFSSIIERRTHLGIRLGQIGYGATDRVGPLLGADLTYLTVGGEYRSPQESFSGSFVDSGIYLGLGGYRLEGNRVGGAAEEETSIGIVIGVMGDFDLSRSLSLRLELSGHLLDSDAAQFFAIGHLGLAYRF